MKLRIDTGWFVFCRGIGKQFVPDKAEIKQQNEQERKTNETEFKKAKSGKALLIQGVAHNDIGRGPREG